MKPRLVPFKNTISVTLCPFLPFQHKFKATKKPSVDTAGVHSNSKQSFIALKAKINVSLVRLM